MITLHIEAQSIEQLRQMVAEQLGLTEASKIVVTMTGPAGGGGGPAAETTEPAKRRSKKSEIPQATEGKDSAAAPAPQGPASTPAEVSDPKTVAVNSAATDSSGTSATASTSTAPTVGASTENPDVPALTDVRAALLGFMTKHGEKAGTAPKTVALLKKYDANMIQDIKADRRAAFIQECNA